MKARRGWTVALWISWFVIYAVFVFGAAVRVDFVEPAVLFSVAWNSIDLDEGWSGALRSDYVFGWAISLLCLLAHTFASAWKVRLGAMVGGFLMPVLAITPLMPIIMVVSPFMIFEMLLGTPDGEFYNEGTPMLAACGMWMMICLIFAVRAALEGWGEKKRVSAAMGA